MPAVTRSRKVARTIMITYIAFGMRVSVFLGTCTLCSAIGPFALVRTHQAMRTPMTGWRLPLETTKTFWSTSISRVTSLPLNIKALRVSFSSFC